MSVFGGGAAGGGIPDVGEIAADSAGRPRRLRRERRPDGVTDVDALEALRRGRIEDPAERLRIASALLESAFYREMYRAMRSTLPEGGLVERGSGEQTFTAMLDERMAEVSALTRSGGGLGEALYQYLARAGGIGEDP